jgi:very-short-patch-repair endonuclease
MSADPLFLALVKRAKLPEPTPEYRFHPTRKWRIDYAWPAHRLALEVEGGIFIRGRHSRGAGMLNDMTKYNALAAMGWRLLRVTPKQLHDLETINLLTATLAA